MKRGIVSTGCRLASLAAGAVLLSIAPAIAADTPPLMPLPRSVTMADSATPLTGRFVAHVSGCGTTSLAAAEDRLQVDIERLTGVMGGFGRNVPLTVTCRHAAVALRPMAGEGYRLTVDNAGVRVDADGPTGVLRAFATVRQLVTLKGGAPALLHAPAPSGACPGS